MFQCDLQETFGIPRLKRSQQREAAELSSWAEFTSYQVCRSSIPRRAQVAGQSVDTESGNQAPRRARSHIKMSKSMSAVAESQHVDDDDDDWRRRRFVVQNKHGHASNSSIQQLIYGNAATATNTDGEQVVNPPLEDGNFGISRI